MSFPFSYNGRCIVKTDDSSYSTVSKYLDFVATKLKKLGAFKVNVEGRQITFVGFPIRIMFINWFACVLFAEITAKPHSEGIEVLFTVRYEFLVILSAFSLVASLVGSIIYFNIGILIAGIIFSLLLYYINVWLSFSCLKGALKVKMADAAA